MVAKWLERLAVIAKGLGSIPASSDTGAADEAVLNNVQKNSPLKKNLVLFRFSNRMRRVRQQSATACGAYASNLLAYVPSTLASCYRMRRIR